MSVRIINPDANNIMAIEMAASTTVTKNTFGKYSSGYLIPATSGDTTTPTVVFLETKTTDSGENPTVNVYVLGPNDILEVDCAANTATNQKGTKVDLSAAGTLANTTTSSGLFLVLQTVGAAANKKVLCRGVNF